ncbi:MAG: hypothetical protein H0T79_08920 [Deltaproteobacteria bacterium]|nr:hypothetical protein [Deltaproteobacteria bacterium]
MEWTPDQEARVRGFTPAYLEYTEIAHRYQESVDRGDTINDIVLRLLREQAATLVFSPPG